MAMRGALSECRLVPGWTKIFLSALKNGYSERMAAKAAGVGLGSIGNMRAKDTKFAMEYENAKAAGETRKQYNVGRTVC